MYIPWTWMDDDKRRREMSENKRRKWALSVVGICILILVKGVEQNENCEVNEVRVIVVDVKGCYYGIVLVMALCVAVKN